ncbi:MAG: hypothetical protein KF789_12960 [Bdellovibrionaceae bacterium]|nr:hypothetical protein [Pseudobdellovibrionaceae bacterium]
MKAIMMTFLLTFLSASAWAAPRCLDLTKDQADKAVSFMKIAIHQKTPVVILSKKERGHVYPMGVWAEKKSGLRGTRSYRVRVDGREVDISLLYLIRSAQHKEAWNLGWMVGCRPAADKPASFRVAM